MSEKLTSNFGSAGDALETASLAGLPKNYGDTKIVILPRDPLWIYLYWEVADGTINELREKIGSGEFDSSKWVLRVYDVTDVEFNGSNANKYFDVDLNIQTDNWYVNVGEVNRNWCVDLGVITPDGRFITVVRSNVLAMPRHGVSPITDEQWAILQREFERLLKLSGVEQIGKSSFDVTKLMRERWEEIIAISAPSSFGGASSFRSAPGGGELNKDFWLTADTELIVYGATEPDATVTVDKQKITLLPDGTFSLRFYLPDGEQNYPIEATSADGTMKRRITFNVTRDTK